MERESVCGEESGSGACHLAARRTPICPSLRERERRALPAALTPCPVRVESPALLPPCMREREQVLRFRKYTRPLYVQCVCIEEFKGNSSVTLLISI